MKPLQDVRRIAGVLISLAVCTAAPMRAQSGQAKPDPTQRVLYRADSGTLSMPNVSADGRWVAFLSGSSLWMARTPDGKPVRLTPAGMYAMWPVFSPTGNAVYFEGNRPGTNDTYLMAVPVNLGTGAVTGPFRQISTDKIVFPGRAIRAVSWDGKLVAYNIDPQTLRLVSSNGGNSRTIGSGGGRIVPAAFSRDNRYVYYTDRHADGSSALVKVSVNGGAPQRVATAKRGSAIALDYAPERAYFVIQPAAGAPGLAPAELFDYSGRKLATQELPIPGGTIRADGRGMAWVKNTVMYWTGKIDLGTHASTQIAGPTAAYPDALLSDGTIVTNKREASGQVTIGIEDTVSAAPHGRAITLPASIRQVRRTIPGDRFLFGTDAPNAAGEMSLYMIDPHTGAIRALQSKRGSLCTSGSDTHTCLVNREGSAVHIESIDPDGKTNLARSFSAADYNNLWGVDVSGPAGAHRITYMIPNAHHDSLNIFVADAPNGSPCAIGAVALPSGARKSAWELSLSPRADRVALIALPPGQTTYHAMFFPISAGTCQAHHPAALDIGLSDLDEYVWLPDGSGVVLAGTTANSQGNAVVLRPTADVASTVLVPDNGVYKDLVGVSRDSRTLFYAGEVTKGSVVYTSDLFPTVK